jgi:hypothetical protein
MSQSADKSAPPRASDPFELWRQIYETNERAWNAVLERTVNNPAFAESSGKILETFLSAQKTVRDNMRTYLEQINLPTREDIARLGELIISLEEKVDQFDDRLARVERALSASETAATKLDDRFARLERSVATAAERRAASTPAAGRTSPSTRPASSATGGGASTSSRASSATGGGASAASRTRGGSRRTANAPAPKDTPR